MTAHVPQETLNKYCLTRMTAVYVCMYVLYNLVGQNKLLDTRLVYVCLFFLPDAVRLALRDGLGSDGGGDGVGPAAGILYGSLR